MTATIDALGRRHRAAGEAGRPIPRPGSRSRHDRVTLRLLPAGRAHRLPRRTLRSRRSLLGQPHARSRSRACRIRAAPTGRCSRRKASATSCASRTTSRRTTRAPCTVTSFQLQDLVSGDPPAEPERERDARDRGRRRRRRAHRPRRRRRRALHGRARPHRNRDRRALVQLGHDPEAVIDYLHHLAVGRGRRGWPESEWQADVVRGGAAAP